MRELPSADCDPFLSVNRKTETAWSRSIASNASNSPQHCQEASKLDFLWCTSRRNDLGKGRRAGEVDFNTPVALFLGPVSSQSASGDVSLDGWLRVGRACRGQRRGWASPSGPVGRIGVAWEIADDE